MKVLLAMSFLLPLCACTAPGAFERAGQKADDAIGNVREGAGDVADDVRDGAKDVRDDVRRTRKRSQQ